jgi:hypothetical protein
VNEPRCPVLDWAASGGMASCAGRARAPWRLIGAIAPKVTVVAHGACAGTEMTAYAGRVVAAPEAFFAPGAADEIRELTRTGD